MQCCGKWLHSSTRFNRWSELKLNSRLLLQQFVCNIGDNILKVDWRVVHAWISLFFITLLSGSPKSTLRYHPRGVAHLEA